MDDSVKSSVRVLSAATRHFTTLGAAVSVLFFCRRFEVDPLQGGKGAEPGKHIGELLTQVLGRALLWARYRFGELADLLDQPNEVGLRAPCSLALVVDPIVMVAKSVSSWTQSIA